MSELETYANPAAGGVGRLRCATCGATYEADRMRVACDCGAPLEQTYRWASPGGVGIDTEAPGIWRYRQLLPVEDHRQELSLGEGNTPIVPLVRLSERLGVRVVVKDEACNPTGSFKARGAAVAVSRLRELGWRRFAVRTSGNGGCAFAAYAARGGVELEVNVVRGEGSTEIAVLEPAAYRAKVMTSNVGQGVKRDREDDVVSLDAFAEPYRVEGDKTLFFELVEQLGGRLPNHLVWPTGGAVGLVACVKALEEMRQLAWLSQEARVNLIAVQHVRCAPIAQALRRRATSIKTGSVPGGIAPGVWVGDVDSSDHVLRRLYSAQDVYGAVGDDRGIESTIREVAAEEGLLLCPEAALAISALPGLKKEGVIREGQTVACVNTASGVRYPHLLRSWYG